MAVWHRFQMRFLRFFIVLCVFLATASFGQAFAQDKVDVRAGSHSNYSRLVFEWPQKPVYSVSKEGDRVLIRFGKAGNADVASGMSADAKNISKIETLSAAGEPLQVAVTIPKGSRFRDFIVENKLIVDVYNPQGSVSQPKATAEPSATEQKPKAVKTEDAPKNVVADVAKGDFTLKRAEDAKTAPVGDVEAAKVPAPALEEHTIAMTSTYSIGVAAYERAGSLWIIMDTPDLPLTPEITGPQKDKFPPLQKFTVPDGVGYRMEIPEGMKVSANGGGLTWHIVIGPKAQERKPVLAGSEEGGDGAKLVWPLKSMRKALSFTDPVVGDKVMVVTASDAKQFTGSVKNYVNLQTLNSAIGLAFTPKSDDVKTEITTQQVSVLRPGGLSLSGMQQPVERRDEAKPEEHAAPEEKIAETDKTAEGKKPEDDESAEGKSDEKPVEKDLALTEAPPEVKEGNAEGEHAPAPEAEHQSTDPAHTATPEELAKVAGQKPSGNNIYNFPSWEMGGIQALDSNQHVIMVGVASKPEEQRGEDIITMAKLNLANNRGAEALGLLRIALQKVPELEDNNEFLALRGAAFALSGKYDEAIIDYSRAGLKDFEDVKYWRAYALAGLEDWKQAIDVMPQSMLPIEAYPKQIRTPLALTFAEIALRAGTVDQGQDILKMLEVEMPKLSLPYRASWNYLAGESQRQLGKAQKAEEYWEPLAKGGKDDLFRAKAGLSLTKLRLDEKKIKPLEAIDALEGLRYAWRGDELETLINFRLGQVYIDNKDYLKGLTVLRNASTLSSPTSDIGKDVRTYMTNAFRDIFANDRLKNVTPMEAISLYEEFKDLAPPGEESDRFVEKLAERLVDADLLGRAASLLEYQVNNRLKGDKRAEIAIRLAAIRLLDGNPDGALRSLEIAQDTLNKIETGAGEVAVAKPDAKADAKADDPKAAATEEKTAPAVAAAKADPEKQRQILLLKARALSLKKKPDEALTILEGMRLDADVNKLRTDVAWSAGKWEEAGMALNDLIVAEDISPRRPLTEYQTDIILNRAIALNLSGNRVALANLRDRYNAQMKNTIKGQVFEIVSRPRRPDMIGSREAIESMMSEIDLFQGFVDGYAKMDAAKKSGVKEPAAPKEPVPVGGKAAETPAPESAPDKPADAAKTE